MNQLFQMAFMADFAQGTKGYIIHSYGIDISRFTTLQKISLSFFKQIEAKIAY